jgi:hypothetical protein
MVMKSISYKDILLEIEAAEAVKKLEQKIIKEQGYWVLLIGLLL